MMGTDLGSHFRYSASLISLDDINILPQPRQTFEHITVLADDIAQKGLINPPTIACMSPQDTAEFLREINALWRSDFTIENLRPA